jgi:hypothetical protein
MAAAGDCGGLPFSRQEVRMDFGRMDFARMTKAQIGAYGAERGIHLDERAMTKAQMIAALEAALPQAATEALRPAAALDAEKLDADLASVQITITRSPARPVRVSVNGRALTLPVGVPVTVPAFVLPVLDAAGVRYSKD